MNTTNNNKYIFFLLCLALIFTDLSVGFAQSNTPYSRFNMGVVREDVFPSYRMSGGLGTAVSQLNQINFSNPASYINIHAVTFDLGVNFDGIVLSGQDSVYKTGEGSLSHLAMGIPLKKNKWGMSFGILPYSHVKYSFIQRNVDPEVGAYNELFSGNGIAYQLYFGNGLQFKNLSIGLNAIYLFGQLEYQKSITFPDSTQNLNVRNSSSLNLGDFAYNIGLQYDIPLSSQGIGTQNQERVMLTLGATGRGQLNVRSRVNQLWETFKIDNFGGSSFLGIRDTVLLETDKKVSTKLPFSISTGFSVHNSPKKIIRRFEGIEWMVGAEFQYSNWSVLNTPFQNEQANDSWRLSIGGKITPELNPREKNYFKRMDYGLGAYTGLSELIIDNEQFREYGITFGVGLPVASAKTFIALDIGSRSNGAENLFRETSYKLSASFTLSDNNWFIKRKFD